MQVTLLTRSHTDGAEKEYKLLRQKLSVNPVQYQLCGKPLPLPAKPSKGAPAAPAAAPSAAPAPAATSAPSEAAPKVPAGSSLLTRITLGPKTFFVLMGTHPASLHVNINGTWLLIAFPLQLGLGRCIAPGR